MQYSTMMPGFVHKTYQSRSIHHFLYIITLWSFIRPTMNQLYPCDIERVRVGNLEIRLTPDTKVKGMKVQFKSCDSQFRDVVEFRGLQFIKNFDRFFRGKNLGRHMESTLYATNHKPVCPQPRVSEVMNWFNLPLDVQLRLSQIGNKTTSQNEDCLWLNLFLPDKGMCFPINSMSILNKHPSILMRLSALYNGVYV